MAETKRHRLYEAQRANQKKREHELRKMLPIQVDNERTTFVDLRLGENRIEAELDTSIFDSFGYAHGGRIFKAIGVAKRNPEDNNDNRIGLLLATGRAFVKVGQKMIHDAEGMIKHREDMAAQKAAQSARKAEKVAECVTTTTPVTELECAATVVSEKAV